MAVATLCVLVVSLGRTGAAARDAGDRGVAPRPVARPIPRAPVAEARVEPLAPTQATPPLVISRDPFAFASHTPPETPRPAPIQIALTPQAPPDIPASLTLSLIGVATTTRGDGHTERTAIVAGPAGALYFVRDGDPMVARYRVDAVLADSVRLVEDATGASLLLALR